MTKLGWEQYAKVIVVGCLMLLWLKIGQLYKSSLIMVSIVIAEVFRIGIQN